MIITAWFVALLALGAIPLIVIGEAWVLWAWIGGVLLLATLDYWFAANPRKVKIERRLAKKVRLSEETSSELFITNLTSRAMRLKLRDAWQPSAQIYPNRAEVLLPAQQRRALSFTLTPARRGILLSRSVTLRSEGPLRLAGRQVTLESIGSIKVLPPFHSRKHLPSRIVKLREIDGKTSVMIRGQGTEFDSLRDYVRGDDVRSIDWRATARRQEVTVRTWRPERDRRVVIVIDTGRTSAARVENETKLDSYFESALLLSALTSQAGDRVEVIAYDRRLRLRVAGLTGAEQISRLMDELATVEAELIETDWTTIPAQVNSLTNGKSLVVLLTSIDSIGATRGLLSVLPQLTSKHTVVIGTVIDSELAKQSQQRSTREEVYLAAATEQIKLENRQLSAAINQIGAQVISASGEQLPTAVVDHYLALKAAGKL